MTAPQITENTLKAESDSSRAFFEASQNIQQNNANTLHEEGQVQDISGLCRNIAAYQSTNNEIINSIKSGNTANAEYLIGTAQRQEAEIRKGLQEAGYKQPGSPLYIENLGNEFEKYADKAKADIDALR